MCRLIVPSTVVSILTLASAVPAATITLTPLDNIQAAVNGASDGDVIELTAGTYQQIFEINGKRLTVRSTNPEDAGTVAATVLNGVGLDSVIRIISTGSGPTVIDGLTITGGDAVSGGGIHISNAVEVHVLRCVIEANVCGNPGGGLYATGTGQILIDACTFRDNQVLAAGGDGGGFYITTGAATVTDCLFENNSVTDAGGGARFDNVSPAQVTNCTFDGNDGNNNGGAIFIRTGTVLTVDACRFLSNTATNGGAMYAWDDAGSATFRNCLFQGNTAASNGGAIFNADAVTVVNGTLEGNMPNAVWGNLSPVTSVSNSIVWNNGATPMIAGTSVSHSLVQFGYPAGNQIIDADPMFVAGGWALEAGSPAIDAGSTSLYCGPMVDLAGASRGVDDPDAEAATGESVIGPIVDMGAFERQVAAVPGCVADIDGDSTVGINDFLAVLAAWGPCP